MPPKLHPRCTQTPPAAVYKTSPSKSIRGLCYWKESLEKGFLALAY